MRAKETGFERRERRVRYKLKALQTGRLRLSVFRSGRHIYAQIIDDTAGKTVVAASSMDKGFDGRTKAGVTKERAETIGRMLAERAMAANIQEVAFDRGGYLYHGRVKSLADGARAAGLKF
jgi:large subunit ribosomal protein L18